MQKGKGVAEQRAPIAEQHLRMVPMIAGPALVSEEEEKKKQAKQKNGTEGKVAESTRTYSQLCVSSGRILLICSNSLYGAGFVSCEIATPRSFSSKAVG